MENKETMNLQQKLIAISNEMPKLLKKHYSDEVDYDFVKIDDIFELLNPAFTKHHICLQELEETDAAYSKVDGSWIYTAKLTFFIVNADCLEEKERVSIQLVGDHLDSPAKAKGAAWTYGFKYFFLYKFRMKQETEDPDMKGTPNGPDKSKERVEYKKSEVPVKPQKPEKKASDVIADSPLAQPPQEEKKQRYYNTGRFFPRSCSFFRRKWRGRNSGRYESARNKEVGKTIFRSSRSSSSSGNSRTGSTVRGNSARFIDKRGKRHFRFFFHRRFKRRKTGEGTKRKQSGRKIKRGEERAEGVGLAIS